MLPSTTARQHTAKHGEHHQHVGYHLSPCEDRGAAGAPGAGTEPEAYNASPWCSVSYFKLGTSCYVRAGFYRTASEEQHHHQTIPAFVTLQP